MQYIHDGITEKSHEKSKILDKITKSSFNVTILSREIALHPTEERPMFQWKIAYTKFGKLIDLIEVVRQEEASKMKSLVYSYNKLFDLYARLIKTINIVQVAKNKDTYVTKIELLNNRIFMETLSIASITSKLIEKNNLEQEDKLRELRVVWTILILFMTLFIFIFSFYISKDITE